MRFISFVPGAGEATFGFRLPDGRVCDLRATLQDPINHSDVGQIPSTFVEAGDLKAWLSSSEGSIEISEQIAEKVISGKIRAVVYGSGEIKLLPPIARPGKIIAIGLNYRDHALEQKASIPQSPLIFAKFPTALIGHGSEIRLPAISEKVDPEAELCFVMLKTGRRFSEQDARTAIAGFTAGIDVSARDLQFGDKQWVRGKSCDTFAPCGPDLVSSSEIPDPHSLAIECRVNGELRQSSNTNQLIFDCYTLVSFISQAITLETGDIVYTGTPAGVGVFRNPPVFLKPGDRVEVTIEKIGTIACPVVAE